MYLTEKDISKAKHDKWWWLYFLGLFETIRLEYDD